MVTSQEDGDHDCDPPLTFMALICGDGGSGGGEGGDGSAPPVAEAPLVAQGASSVGDDDEGLTPLRGHWGDGARGTLHDTRVERRFTRDALEIGPSMDLT